MARTLVLPPAFRLRKVALSGSSDLSGEFSWVQLFWRVDATPLIMAWSWVS